MSGDRLYVAQDREGKARSTLGFASQNSVAPRPTPLPRSAPQEPGGRNGPGVAGGKNLPKGSEADERLAFKEKNRPQLGTARALVLKVRAVKQDRAFVRLEDEVS